MSENQSSSVGKSFLARVGNFTKNVLWPIEKSELKLFVPMALMMLCVLFNFGALRSIKDSLVVPNIGAEAISFLKLWFVLPSTILFTFVYMQLSNRFNYETIFYLIVSFFLMIFFLFTYIFYPYQDIFHPGAEVVEGFIHKFPHLKWFALIASKWSYAVMYIFCELWSAVVINLMFWQYANHIFDTNSAKRFYPILSMIGNMGLIIAGNFLVAFSDLSGVSDIIMRSYTSKLEFECECVLKPMMQTIIFSGITAMILYRYVERHVLRHASIKQEFAHSGKKTRTKLSFLESIKLIVKSKYIGHIVFLILSYGLLINILEGPWKAKVREMYPSTVSYMHFMGKFNIWMGVSCIVFGIIGSNVLRKTSWFVGAMFTPIMIAVTGIFFFFFVIFSDDFNSVFDWFDPLYFAVIIGAVQNILSKSSKYSLFDSTKEMAYIPLSLELRTKGKAAVEVIGLKFGKSLGAFIQSSMFILVPLATFDSAMKYLVILFSIVVCFWIWNVRKLGAEYTKLKENKNEAD